MTGISSTDFLGRKHFVTTKPPETIQKRYKNRTVELYQVEAVLMTELTQCPHCGAMPPIFKKNGTKPCQVIKDTPRDGFPVEIHFARQCYRCVGCKQTFLQPLPDISKQHRATDRLIEYVEKQIFENGHSFISVSREVDIEDKVIRTIGQRYYQKMKNAPRADAPKCIGVDECHLPIGTPFVLVDNINKRVIDILDKRNKTEVRRCLMKLPGWKNVRAVTMDMHRPYYDVVRAVLPGVVIIIDPFHVADKLNKAVNKVRVEIRSKMTRKERRAILSDRELLWKERDGLSPEQQADLRTWLRAMPDLRKAYFLKERFKKLRNAPSTEGALRRYKKWKTRVPQSLLAFKEFREALTALENWKQEIFNWVDYPYDNAFAERVNKDIKKYYRDSNGCSLDVIRARMLSKKYNRHKRASATRKSDSIQGDKPILPKAASKIATATTFPVRPRPHQPLLPIVQSEQEEG
jgi:transposase